VNLLAEILKEAEVSRKSGFQSNESNSKYDPTILRMPARIAAFDHEARLHVELFRTMLTELMAGLAPNGALAEA